MKFLLAVVMIGLLGGCGNDPPPPAIQPAATQPAAASATLDVGGEPVTFASVTLDVKADGDTLFVTLAGSDGQTPSRQSFYFAASIPAETPEELPGQVWRFKHVEGEEVDGAAGVFMEGNALRFLPVDMQIDFGGKWPDVTVAVKGKLLRDGDEFKPVSLKGKYTVRGR